MKHLLRPQRSVSLLQGIIRIAMISKNNVIAVLHALDGRVEVIADVGDHHVHVRARETADELRQRKRKDQPACRRDRRSRNGLARNHLILSHVASSSRILTAQTTPG
jgi:hypothetical protein